MDYAWFIYTIAIMAIAIMAFSTSVTVWVLTNRKDCLVAATGFLVYTFDVGSILFDEYIRAKPELEEYFVNGLTHPVVNIVLRVALVSCVWLWIAMRVHAKIERKHIIAFVAVYTVASVLLAPIGSFTGTARTMAFWGLSDVAVISSLVFAWWWRNNKASETERLSIDRSKTTFKVSLVLAVLMLFEDVFNILFLKSINFSDTMLEFYWHLTERNLSENLLMVFLAVCMMLYNRDVMRIFSQHPMESVNAQGESPASQHRDYEMRLLRFADDHGLSKREREVLGLAIEGKDTQGIASELYISTGTVKAHMHRIYTKAGVEHRQDLINAFWKY
ncbi:MAG: helix-turn-helix transcriptional regulator [Atopobiaceae bacterium]|nr:helix-turn-helix transcriptional regulator [Atopobiaceae bacterium]